MDIHHVKLRGNGQYEQPFKVRVEGIESIVEQAISGRSGLYELGTFQFGQPGSLLSEARVTLKTGAEKSTYWPAPAYAVERPFYKLEAELEQSGSRHGIPVEVKHLSDAGFDVTGNQTFFHIRRPRSFPHDSVAQYSGQWREANLTYRVVASGWTKEAVSKTVSGFAEALEAVVNGAYKAAGQKSPPGTFTLQLGEEVKRIEGRRIASEAAPSGSVQKPGAGGHDAETPAPHFEAGPSDVTFNRIGGYQAVKDQLGDLLYAIKEPQEARRQGFNPSKGWLLHGPPGTGKTLFGRALAGEAGSEFVYFNAANALQMYVGQSTKALAAAFEGAQKRADETKKPVILFIDEIDSILPKRGTAHHVNDELVNLFNQYMDGFESNKIPNVYVVAATNRLPEMDESATRAGRFVKVHVPLPDLEARTAIFPAVKKELESKAGNLLFDPTIDYSVPARMADGFSGADIAYVMGDVRGPAFRKAMATGQKAVVRTTAADIGARIASYKSAKRKQDPHSRGPYGFPIGQKNSGVDKK